MAIVTANNVSVSGDVEGARATSAVVFFGWINLPSPTGITWGFVTGSSLGYGAHFRAPLAGEIVSTALFGSTELTATLTFGAFTVVIYVNGALQDTSSTYSTPGSFTAAYADSHSYLTAGPDTVSVTFAAGDIINVGIDVTTTLSGSVAEPCVTLFMHFDTI
jgi:hypothetical protein